MAVCNGEAVARRGVRKDNKFYCDRCVCMRALYIEVVAKYSINFSSFSFEKQNFLILASFNF